ncbi:ATP-binding protein [Pseudonocardia pini]|uniref:ATP-binding protein n=1 Tax=Pseudonocardia pini TaxID=2758030 RepID=UPI0015F08008|nr:LuxR C-terminal-related transcriptional regulator [Pseudonocardia pini]
MEEQRAARPRGNLPTATSSFVGRHGELAEVKRRMEASRLLTLAGPGGVGKTRLAIQAAALARRAFPDGVWMVDLAPLEDPSRLADTVAAALQVTDQSSRRAKRQLVDHLRDRSLLIVLDNCEHVIDACAQLVDQLTHEVAGIRVLATSRQPLGISGEQVMPVTPLPVPDPEGPLHTDDMKRYESVALLLDRATAVQPSFELSASNAQAVARLCSRLDGLPLAIELAATRLRSLSVEQIVGRLDDRFRLLSRGSRSALSRQQTLRALIDWSFDLCSEQEQLLWARLSIFPGTFDLDAVEGICTDEDIDDVSVLDLLDDLVAKSVVAVHPGDGRARYRLLETIRQYGREMLVARGEDEVLRCRHRDFYLNIAERAADAWCGPEQAEILSRLRAEHDNLGAALDWSVATRGEEDMALRLAVALRYHWLLGGFLATGRRRMDQALVAAPGRSVLRGHALWVTAWIAHVQGDRDVADARTEECAEIAEAAQDPHLRGYAELLRGTGTLFSGDPHGAVPRFEAGIAAVFAASDTAAELWGLFQLSVALSHDGQSGRAREACERAITTAAAAGETWARSEALWALAFDHWLVGDPDRVATDLTLEGLTLTPAGNQVSTVLGVELLAWIAASQGRADDAARRLGAAEAIWQAFGANVDGFGPVFTRHSAECREIVAVALPASELRDLLAEGRRYSDTFGTAPAHEPVTDSAQTAPGGTAADVLTPREYDVAKLIAKGLTNRAIADELVLSRRTVDGHTERLYAKIEVSNRAQVATWMAQHDRP